MFIARSLRDRMLRQRLAEELAHELRLVGRTRVIERQRVVTAAPSVAETGDRDIAHDEPAVDPPLPRGHFAAIRGAHRNRAVGARQLAGRNCIFTYGRMSVEVKILAYQRNR